MKNKIPGRPPVKADLHKQKATVHQFVQLAQEAQDAHKNLATKTNKAVNELWRNQQEMLQGLGASEFNLRAHQKVMNAFALELEDLFKHLPMPAGANIEVRKSFLAMKEIPKDDGSVVRRIDWEYYHAQVDEELKAIAEEEKKAEETVIEAAEKATPAEPSPVETAPAEPTPAEPEAKEEGGPEFPDGATIFQ